MKEIPYGYCQCGCGGKTNIATRNDSRRHSIKGEPFKFIKYHNMLAVPLNLRFWNKVDKRGANECWTWLAAKSGNATRASKFGSYGKFRLNSKKMLAHRAAWELTHGEIPPGLYVLHKCDNPSCCNPNHLFLGNQQDNMDDMNKKGRGRQSVNPPIGTRQHMAKLTEDIVLYARSVYRPRTKGLSASALAVQFGVGQQTMYKAIHKKTWKHI